MTLNLQKKFKSKHMFWLYKTKYDLFYIIYIVLYNQNTFWLYKIYSNNILYKIIKQINNYMLST